MSQAFPKGTPPLAAPSAFGLQPGPQLCLTLTSHLSCQTDTRPEPSCDGLPAPAPIRAQNPPWTSREGRQEAGPQAKVGLPAFQAPASPSASSQRPLKAFCGF